MNGLIEWSRRHTVWFDLIATLLIGLVLARAARIAGLSNDGLATTMSIVMSIVLALVAVLAVATYAAILTIKKNDRIGRLKKSPQFRAIIMTLAFYPIVICIILMLQYAAALLTWFALAAFCVGMARIIWIYYKTVELL